MARRLKMPEKGWPHREHRAKKGRRPRDSVNHPREGYAVRHRREQLEIEEKEAEECEDDS